MSVPNSSNWRLASERTIVPTEIIVLTAATPMAIPMSASPVRCFEARRLLVASAKLALANAATAAHPVPAGTGPSCGLAPRIRARRRYRQAGSWSWIVAIAITRVPYRPWTTTWSPASSPLRISTASTVVTPVVTSTSRTWAESRSMIRTRGRPPLRFTASTGTSRASGRS